MPRQADDQPEEEYQAYSDSVLRHFRSRDVDTTEEALIKALQLVGKTFHAMGDTAQVTAKFAKAGEETGNFPGTNKIILDAAPAENLTKRASTEQRGLAQDTIIGDALLGAASKATADGYVATYLDARTEPEAVQRLFLAAESFAAQKRVEHVAPGFTPYLDARVDFRDDPAYRRELAKSVQTDTLDAESALSLIQHDMTDRARHIVKRSNTYADIAVQCTNLLKSARTPGDRLDAAKTVWKMLKDAEEEQPEGEGEGEGQGEGEGEGEGTGKGQGKGQQQGTDPGTDPTEGEDPAEGDKDKDDGEGEGEESQPEPTNAPESPAAAADKRMLMGEQQISAAAPDADSEEVNSVEFQVTRMIGSVKIVHQQIKSDPIAAQAHALLLKTVERQAARIRESLSWRAEATEDYEFALPSGDIDEGSLTNLLVKDTHPRVFQRREVVSKPAVEFSILLDESGSMSRDKMQQAKQVIAALQSALSGIDGVTLQVFGYEDGWDRKTQLSAITIREFTDPAAIILARGNGGTPTGAAIVYTANLLRKRPTEATSRYLFVISDGQPNASMQAINATEEVSASCQFARQIGVQTFGIGICDAYSQAASDRMYGPGKGTVVSDVMSVGRILGKFMAKALLKSK